MIARYKINESSWIDLSNPTPEEIKSIGDEYLLDNSITEDMASPTPKPHTQENGKYIYSIFHIPVFKHSHKEEEQEIDFIIGRNLLITTRYDSIDSLHKFEKEAEAQEILGKGEYRHNHIFFHMMREIHKSLFDELSYIEDWISSIEKNIFKGFEKEMVFAISQASKNLLNFRKAIGPHQDILEFIKTEGSKKLGEHFGNSIQSLLESCRRITQIAHDHSEMLSELRETNNSLLDTKQNEIMKILTIFTFIFLPASVIASLFGVSVTVPIKESPNAFYLILCIIILASGSLFTFLKIKKWI